MREVRAVCWAIVCSLGLVGCVGEVGGQGGIDLDDPRNPERPTRPTDPIDPANPLIHPSALGESGIARLTRAEYRQTVFDLLETEPGAQIELLPVDDVTPFDNDYTTQTPSRTLVEALKSLADSAAERAVTDTDFRERLLGCTPSGVSDLDCFQTFIATFGRRAIRRPLSTEEVAEFAGFLSFAETADDFYLAVSMAIRAFLQDMEFIYRAEIGEEVSPGVYRLNDFEFAARLSYLLWGSTPDDTLLDRAAAGDLSTAASVEDEVVRLLSDARGIARTQRFHSMWLGYEDIALAPALSQSLRAESDALIERVVFDEGRSWRDLFTLNETFIDDALADHYGMDRPGAPTWVTYDGSQGRAGILSHGAFLSGGAKFGDTSPTQRGLLVRNRLLCQDIPAPDPSLGVDVDEPPESETGRDCKADRYHMRETSACAGCHLLMDSIGFGLEQYGGGGEFRIHDNDQPECAIDGEGEVQGIGSFNGAAGLADLLLETGDLEPCFARQFFRFSAGRLDTSEDEVTIQGIEDAFTEGEFDLRALITTFVTSPAFRHRVEGGE